MPTGKRKEDHLRICLNESVQFQRVGNGFQEYYFVHQALPELDLNKVDLAVTLFGKRLSAPVVISSMVGGIGPAAEINRNLAQAAQKLGLAFGLGSERILIESPEAAESYRVRDVAPDILLFANLGAVQLNYGFGAAECLKAVNLVGADALLLHLNPLQEALQPEGNTNFERLTEKITEVCSELPVPVVIKETGCGISADAARRLIAAGVAGLDVAGAGGTCWSEVEKYRTDDILRQNIAGRFADWGIPTAEALVTVREAAPNVPLIASGGLRSGIDAAKAIALGADAVGIGWPLLKPATQSAAASVDYLEEIIEVLRIAMFCTGTPNINKLKNSPQLRKT